MKTVKITGFLEPDRQSVYTASQLYRVNLGNGIDKRFGTKKEALKFLAEVSRFLTYKLHECNELYVACFSMYRRAWFYFDHNKPRGRSVGDLREKERLCEHNLRAVADAFTLLYRRSNWTNGNHFVFTHFNVILNALAEVCQVLAYVYENKSVAGLQYQIEILSTKIAYCRRTIDNYTVEIENSFKDSQLPQLKVV